MSKMPLQSFIDHSAAIHTALHRNSVQLVLGGAWQHDRNGDFLNAERPAASTLLCCGSFLRLHRRLTLRLYLINFNIYLFKKLDDRPMVSSMMNYRTIVAHRPG